MTENVRGGGVATAAESALEVRGLEAGYGKIQVLWGIDLDVAPGEFVAIIGANGAGKTTLMRTVSGLIPARAGTVRALGRSIRGLSAARVVRGGVGHVPEGRQLFALMSVRENLDAGADYLPEARERADRNRSFVYELFPRLKERERQLAGTLSGGERQMVAIGRALMSNPRLLLVDEPSLGLSPALTRSVFEALAQINADGVTVVLVEQNVQGSLQLADHAVVLEHGEVRLRGTGAELLTHPKVREAYLSL
jgi:branched-chain amino acid transport system ATP-binding protein